MQDSHEEIAAKPNFYTPSYQGFAKPKTLYIKKSKKRRASHPGDNTWVTLWSVTLVNHNVTNIQRNKKIL